MPGSIKRLFRFRVAGSARSSSGSDRTVLLVYARTTHESDEPLVAVCTRENEARSLEREVIERGSRAEVRWETHELIGDGAGDVVYVVVEVTSETPEPLLEPDPVGLGVFARREQAEAVAAGRCEKLGTGRVVVWPLPIGWRRLGWPFDRDTPAPILS